MENDKLAETARNAKITFLKARSDQADYNELKRLGAEYIDAIAAWHQARFPEKKFHKPSIGYLIRAL